MLSIASVIFGAAPDTAQTLSASPNLIQWHSTYVEALRRSQRTDGADPRAVFEQVLRTLQPETHVYPSENYLYFSFVAGGLNYRGNIRFSNDDRDKGLLHFAYFADENQNLLSLPSEYSVVLGTTDGLKLTKLAPCIYSVTYKGVKRTFILNCYSHWRLTDMPLIPREEVMGPLFDDSGLQFVLTYDYGRHKFLYNLANWEAPSESFAQLGCCLLVGRRTGFVFLNERKLKRRVLVAVREASMTKNDAFDGPFDQLPHNWIHDDRLFRAIEDQTGGTAKIDLRGNLANEADAEYFVGNYTAYRDFRDIRPIYDCLQLSRAAKLDCAFRR